MPHGRFRLGLTRAIWRISSDSICGDEDEVFPGGAANSARSYFLLISAALPAWTFRELRLAFCRLASVGLCHHLGPAFGHGGNDRALLLAAPFGRRLAIEESDSFDAIGSSFGFISQRPFSYFLYILIAAVVTSAGLILFSLLIQVGMSLLTFGMVAGGGQDVYLLISASSRNSDNLSSSVMKFWEFFASFLTDAYLFSAFWTSATGIFLLMRHDVDGAELDDIYRDDGENEKPMPKLAREMGLTGEAASMTSPVAPPAAKAD